MSNKMNNTVSIETISISPKITNVKLMSGKNSKGNTMSITRNCMKKILDNGRSNSRQPHCSNNRTSSSFRTDRDYPPVPLLQHIHKCLVRVRYRL